MKSLKIFLLVITLCYFQNYYAVSKNPDMVVCTYNRPLQLRAFLESFFKYVTNYGQITIIARIDKDFEEAYQKVADLYPQCSFIKQSQENPRADYKQLNNEAIFNTPSDYMLFGVDDIVVTDYFDLNSCVDALEETGAYGFYLRLGKNITRCLKLNLETPVPDLQAIKDGMHQWKFNEATGDWNYPNSMDMTVLRKADIKQFMLNLPFNTPNTLEGEWSKFADLTKSGLCFEYAKIVNLQFNVVQDEWPYSIEKDIDVKVFLDKFNQGLKLDISDLFCMRNSAPHVEGYCPRYTQADEQELTLRFHKNRGMLAHEFLADLKNLFKCKNFIETGTYLGDTAQNATVHFESVYTVELSEDLFKKMEHILRGYKNLFRYNGKSELFLEKIFHTIEHPQDSIVYLDAHYSGGCTATTGENTPILKELAAIKSHKITPVIIVDDIRFFQHELTVADELRYRPEDQAVSGYPTIHALKAAILDISPSYQFIIYNDLAIAYPQNIYPHIAPSALIKSITCSRMFDCYTYTPQELNEVLAAEKYMIETNSAEMNSIKDLIYSGAALCYPKRFAKDYYLWNALIHINQGNILDAQNILLDLKNLSIKDARIDYYLDMCASQLKP